MSARPILSAKTPICDYCQQPSERVTGAVVYPHRPDLANKIMYLCRPCNAWVGCHPGTDRPLGRFANAELRAAKMAAHAALDPLWRKKMRVAAIKKGKARGLAYAWLSRQLGIDPKECHIGMFDVATCRRVVEVIAEATRR